ncbi:Uncharacterised protein [Segatella copri]|nr:Uncharacterised protein [Segatella copri]
MSITHSMRILRIGIYTPNIITAIIRYFFSFIWLVFFITLINSISILHINQF